MSLLPQGALAYVAPYAAFLALAEAGARWPDLEVALFPLRVIAPAALLGWFWSKGAYAELRGYPLGRGTAADVAAGLAVAALWLGPYLLWPALPRGEPFDPALYGDARRPLAFGLRLLGFALVTPLVEELFVRSFLVRFAERFERGDFRDEPIARFALRGFVVSVLWFGFSHAAWEWWVAFPAGLAFNAWLYTRGSLMPCVVAHAAANAAIWAVVVGFPGSLDAFL